MRIQNSEFRIQKLPGFTLMELLVVMVLSALVIASAGMGFKFIVKQYGLYDKLNDGNTALASFYAVMNNDMQNADKVMRHESDLVCRMDSQGVVYSFGGDFVLRVQDLGFRVQGDTFRVQVGEAKMQELENGLVEQISLKVEDKVLVFNKQYSAEQLMKQ